MMTCLTILLETWGFRYGTFEVEARAIMNQKREESDGRSKRR